jgi:hypothetical protein
VGAYADFTVGNVRNTLRRLGSYHKAVRDFMYVTDRGESLTFNDVDSALIDIRAHIEQGLGRVAWLRNNHKFPAKVADWFVRDYIEAKNILKYNWK